MMWVAYTPHGMEFALVEDCEVLGITAIAPRKVEAVRTGNNRWPEPRITPYLPNYVFVTATDEEWHWLKDIRYVRDIMGILPQWERSVRSFIDAVETDYTSRMTEIEQAQKIMRDKDATKEQRRMATKAMSAYQPNDLLEVMTGPFAGMVATFGRLVEDAARATPEIEASLMLFGRESTVRFDPLTIKKAG